MWGSFGVLTQNGVATPHAHMASGRYQQPEFAADLFQVITDCAKPEYLDPQGILSPHLLSRRTHPPGGARSAAPRGQTGDVKYFWSNFAVETPLAVMVEYAHRRMWVEQFHEEAQELLGWDQYQGRLWPGFHRNAALIMLSYGFLVWWEWQERMRQVRRGRPRGDFSPSARSTPNAAASHPSPNG